MQKHQHSTANDTALSNNISLLQKCQVMLGKLKIAACVALSRSALCNSPQSLQLLCDVGLLGFCFFFFPVCQRPDGALALLSVLQQPWRTSSQLLNIHIQGKQNRMSARQRAVSRPLWKDKPFPNSREMHSISIRHRMLKRPHSYTKYECNHCLGQSNPSWSGGPVHQVFSYTILWHIIKEQKISNLVVLQAIHTLRGSLKESARASVCVCTTRELCNVCLMTTFGRNVSWNREGKGEVLNILVKGDLLDSRHHTGCGQV